MKLLISVFVVLVSAVSWAYDFVQVSGEGEVKVKPDFISIQATVFSRSPTAQAAQSLNAKEMARVNKILKQDFKIEAKDIQTSSFQVQPQYDYAKDRPVFRGMNVSHSLRVKFRKVDEVGNLLDRLVEGQSQENLGVRIEEISFGTDQLKSYQVQALEAAMLEAKNRALTLAKSGGKSLGVVRKISDSQVSEDGIRPLGVRTKMAAMEMAADSGSTQISGGELSVKAQVQVEYELK